MDYKRVSDLDPVSSITSTDLMEVQHDNGDSTYTSYKVTVANVRSSIVTGGIGCNFDGSSAELAVGLKAYVIVPYSCTITEWAIVANTTGSLVIDVWKAHDSIPTVINTITDSSLPTLSSQQYASSNNVSTWTTNVIAGDVMAFYVNSCTTITSANILLTINK